MMSMMSGIHKNISFVEENEDINDILVVFLCAHSKRSFLEYLLMSVSSFFWPLNYKRSSLLDTCSAGKAVKCYFCGCT